MSFTTITLTGTYAGAPAGYLEFELISPISQPDQPVQPRLIHEATLNGSGAFSIVLPATNDPTTYPIDSAYQVTEVLNNALINVYDIVLPYNSVGGTIDLSECQQVLPMSFPNHLAVLVRSIGTPNGVASLDQTGNVPLSELGNVPSGMAVSLNDVVGGSQTINTSSLPITTSSSTGVIILTGSTASKTLTLGTSSFVTSQMLAIVNESSVAVALATASGTIDTTNLLAHASVLMIFDGTNWNTLGSDSNGASSGVSSFNTRTGAIAPTNGDYSLAKINGGTIVTSTSALPATTVFTTGVQILTGSIPGQTLTVGTTSFVNGQLQAVYNQSSVSVTLASATGSIDTTSLLAGAGALLVFDGTNWNTLASDGNGTVSGVSSFDSRTGAITPAAGDYTLAKINGAITTKNTSALPYTTITTDSVVELTGSTASKTLTLGTTSFVAGQLQIVLNASSVSVIIAAATGTTDTTALAAGAGILMCFDGTNWGTAGSDSNGNITLTGTQTLTNKRVTLRSSTTAAPGATPTINTDNLDYVRFTGLATAITSMTTNLSGTPVLGDRLLIEFTDNGTARAITWGASFESSTVTLPVTTVTSTMLLVGFVWNVATSKWRCVALA